MIGDYFLKQSRRKSSIFVSHFRATFIIRTVSSFKKREFVVEYADNPMYPQFIKFQLVQDRTNLLDGIEVGDKLEVTFNLRGREWTDPQGEKKYFNSLDAWRIQKIEAQNSAPAPDAAGAGTGVYDMAADMAADQGADDLPF